MDDNVVDDTKPTVLSGIETGMLGSPVTATRLAGREIVDSGMVIAAGGSEYAPWAAETTVCSVVGES